MKLTRIPVALGLLIATLLAAFVPLAASAQASTTPAGFVITPASTATTPTTPGSLSSVLYETFTAVVTPAANGQTASVTFTATSSATPSVGAIPINPFTITTGEATPRTIQVASATIPAQNNLIASPTIKMPPVPASSTGAGLGLPPATGLPAPCTIANGIFVVTFPPLDGGQTATLTVAGFPVIQPTGGQAAVSSASSSSH